MQIIPKRWVKPLSEVSLGMLLVILVVIGVGVKLANGAGMPFYQRVGAIVVCTVPPANPCTPWGLMTPYTVVSGMGSQDFVAVNPATRAGGLPQPRPGGWVLGLGAPGSAFQATRWWAY
ncbi:MAG: hypothetical protein WC817_04520 [Patescibacteria group bacterium]|jgi:hypothetical protein